MLWLRPGSDGIRTIRHFLSLVADRYYQLMRDTIRKFDPDALFLGDRYQSFYYPEVVPGQPAVCRRRFDQPQRELERRHVHPLVFGYAPRTLTGKPIVVSEFYMAAKENRSGNKNAVGGFPELCTQHERAAGLVEHAS